MVTYYTIGNLMGRYTMSINREQLIEMENQLKNTIKKVYGIEESCFKNPINDYAELIKFDFIKKEFGL